MIEVEFWKIFSKFWKVGFTLKKVRQTSVWQTVWKFWFNCLCNFSLRKDFIFGIVSNARGKKRSQINQNFWTICHTEVCFTFSRVIAGFSELAENFLGQNLKINLYHYSSKVRSLKKLSWDNSISPISRW